MIRAFLFIATILSPLLISAQNTIHKGKNHSIPIFVGLHIFHSDTNGLIHLPNGKTIPIFHKQVIKSNLRRMPYSGYSDAHSRIITNRIEVSELPHHQRPFFNNSPAPVDIFCQNDTIYFVEVFNKAKAVETIKQSLLEGGRYAQHETPFKPSFINGYDTIQNKIIIYTLLPNGDLGEVRFEKPALTENLIKSWANDQGVAFLQQKPTGETQLIQLNPWNKTYTTQELTFPKVASNWNYENWVCAGAKGEQVVFYKKQVVWGQRQNLDSLQLHIALFNLKGVLLNHHQLPIQLAENQHIKYAFGYPLAGHGFQEQYEPSMVIYETMTAENGPFRKIKVKKDYQKQLFLTGLACLGGLHIDWPSQSLFFFGEYTDKAYQNELEPQTATKGLFVRRFNIKNGLPLFSATHSLEDGEGMNNTKFFFNYLNQLDKDLKLKAQGVDDNMKVKEVFFFVDPYSGLIDFYFWKHQLPVKRAHASYLWRLSSSGKSIQAAYKIHENIDVMYSTKWKPNLVTELIRKQVAFSPYNRPQYPFKLSAYDAKYDHPIYETAEALHEKLIIANLWPRRSNYPDGYFERIGDRLKEIADTTFYMRYFVQLDTAGTATLYESTGFYDGEVNVYQGKAPKIEHKIRFFHGLDSAQQLANQKQIPIFIDIYTDWCGPCKKMDKEAFRDKSVANYFNANFVSLKANPETSDWAKALAEKYKVTGYPTLLFVDADGEVLYRSNSAKSAEELLAIGQGVITGNHELDKYQKRFEKGERSRAFIEEYAMLLEDAGRSYVPAFNAYFTSLPQDSLFSQSIWRFINKKIWRTDNQFFQFLEKNNESYQKLYGDSAVSQTIFNLYRRHINGIALSGGDSLEYEAIRTKINSKELKGKERLIIMSDQVYYASKGYWKLYAQSFLQFAESLDETGALGYLTEIQSQLEDTTLLKTVEEKSRRFAQSTSDEELKKAWAVIAIKAYGKADGAGLIQSVLGEGFEVD